MFIIHFQKQIILKKNYVSNVPKMNLKKKKGLQN